MDGADDVEARIAQLRSAFGVDGYSVPRDGVIRFRDRIGLVARHRTATNHDSGEPKRAYYVEGTPYEMGYLMGRLAEPAIQRMTETFIDHMVHAMVRMAIRGERLDFTGVGAPTLIPIHGLLIDLVHEMLRAHRVRADIPIAFHQEIRGLVAGCRDTALRENRTTRVTEEELWVLNAGIDCILSRAYTGILLPARAPRWSPKDLWIPIACNGFAILNEAAADGALFGRDYMFPTGGVFQEVAGLIIQRPTPWCGETSLPFVSMSAPGFVGSIAAMNTRGVAAGVDIAVGANSDPHRPGINSLLLVRDAVQHGSSAEAAVRRIIGARRGVTWNYIVADGGRPVDRACVVEAGASIEHIPFLSYPAASMRRFLPDQQFLDDHPSEPAKNGAMVRWDQFHLPRDWIDTFNPRIWRRFRRCLHRDAFSPYGRINHTPEERNCPTGYYFAPLRGRKRNVILTTNHFVIPEMRLCSMHPWANRIFSRHHDGSQWRYDELNRRILTTLDRRGPIDRETAKRLLCFLYPDGDYPHFYARNPRSRDGKERLILGSTTLFDLKARIVETHYGFYNDAWVQLSLGNYVDPP